MKFYQINIYTYIDHYFFSSCRRTDLYVLFGHSQSLIGQIEVSQLLLGHFLLLLQSLDCRRSRVPESADLLNNPKTPHYKPVYVSTNKPVYVSTNKPVYVSTNKPVYVSTNKPVYVSTNKPVYVSTNKPVYVSTNKTVSVSTYKTILCINVQYSRTSVSWQNCQFLCQLTKQSISLSVDKIVNLYTSWQNSQSYYQLTRQSISLLVDKTYSVRWQNSQSYYQLT